MTHEGSPEERKRVKELLEKLPVAGESKTKELHWTLSDLPSVHPDEKIVVFTALSAV